MHCPKCQSEDIRVVDSRTFRGGTIRRRRECNDCGWRFTTLEEMLRENIFILKRDGRREALDRDKLMKSLYPALHRRPIDREQLNLLVIDALNSLEQEYDNEIPSRALAEQIMQRLKNIDRTAWQRYAAGHLEFKEVSKSKLQS